MQRDPEAFKKYNVENEQKFKKNKNSRFHCVRCGREVDIDTSASHRGRNLICMHCFYHYENNYKGSVFYWLAEVQTSAFE